MPGKTKKRKDPSPSKVRGQVEPDEGNTPKEHWRTCPECPNLGYLPVFERFAEHMRDVHNYRWVCPVCGRIMPDKGKLNFHVQRVHGISGKTHMCHYPGCSKSFTTTQYLLDHFPIHGHEHSCRKCGHGHRKKTDWLDHERCCDGPFNREAFEALHESTALTRCENCGRIFMQAEYTAHLEACNRKYLERKKGKSHPARTSTEEGRPACPQQGEQIAGLPSMFVSDTPQPSQLMPTHEQEPTAAPSPWQQGELPQGLSRVKGRCNVATSKRKPRKESSTIQDPEFIELHSSDEGNGSEKGGSSTSSHTGGQGARAQYHHQQRIDQIFEEEGWTELLQAFRHTPLVGETGDMSQIEGASPSAKSRPPVRKPCTVPEVLRGTVHDKPAEELMMVSASEEQVQTESQAVSPSQETVIVNTSSTPDMTITPQGLVLSDLETATTPTLMIRGDHVLVSPSEPEGSLVKEMASSAAGHPSQHDSPTMGEEGAPQGEQDPVEIIDVDGESDGSHHSEIILNPRAAVERSARERGIRSRRSFRRR